MMRPFQEVNIIGSDQPQIEITGDFNQTSPIATLLFDAMIAELEAFKMGGGR